MPFAFRTALRALLRRPSDALINVLGLALGLACCALIALHVSAERGADRQHDGGDRVVRIGTDLVDTSGSVQRVPSLPRPMAAALAGDAAVEALASATVGTIRVQRTGGNEVAQTLFVGSDFLDVFNGYTLVAGDADALRAPGGLVLTESAALRLTGAARPLGQTVEAGGPTPYTVTGIVEDGARSHLAFDALAPIAGLEGWDPAESGSFDLHLYARLQPGADRAGFARRVQHSLDDVAGAMMEASGWRVAAVVQPLRTLYLAEDERLLTPLHRVGQPALLRTLSLVGLFVLLVAGVNFVNLATARSAERAREVGVRKAVGAARNGLVAQFLAEAVLLALAAGLAALALVALGIPTYNALTGAGLGVRQLVAPVPLGIGLAVVGTVGLVAGLYPAVALSGFRPAETLRGSFASGREGAALRRGLVVFQFGVSTALLVATLVVGAQLRHLRAQDPGFDRERVLLVSAENVFGSDELAIREAFARVPGVEAVSLTGAAPTNVGWEAQSVSALGRSGQTQTMETVLADADYAKVLGLDLVAGRDFARGVQTDQETAVLLNEAGARALGWTPEEAVGKRIETAGRSPGEVVGVLADYAHHGLGQAPRPQVFFDLPGQALDLAVRVGPDPGVRDRLAAVWQARVAGYPFEATDLDAAVAAQYRAEERLARAFGLFALLAVVVAGLGLFGLAAYAVQRRTKEVGVRKVLGATVGQLVARLTADFARPVVLGVALAAPVAWWALARWLDGFATRVAITPLPFVVAGLAALAVAVLTVSLHTVRAARADPTRSLRAD